MLKRRKWLVLTIMTMALSAMGGIVFSLPDIYQASARLVVERQQLPESFVKSTVTSEVSSRLQTITQELLSPERLTHLIQQFNLYADLQTQMPLKQIIKLMRQDIELGEERSHQRRSSVTTAFTLSYRGSAPQKVAQVTNALASFYIEENVKVREQQATETSQFLQDQLATIRDKLEAQEQRMSQYKEQYIGELPEQLNANLATLERLNYQLRLTNDKLARTNERREALARQLAQAEDSGSTAGQLDMPLNAQLANLQQQLQALQTRFSDKYPTVIRLKAEIAALERQLAVSPSNGVGARNSPMASISSQGRLLQEEMRAVDAEMKVLRNEEQSLLQSINAYQQRVENTPQREQEVQTLARDYETIQTLYHSLLQRQEEAKLAASMEQNQQGEQFRLLESATPPTHPAVPNRVRLLLVGVLLSLGLAAGAAFMADGLDTTFHAADDLRTYAGVPVLQSLPHIDVQSDRRRRQWRFVLAMVAVMIALGGVAGLTHLIAKDNTQLVKVLAL